MHPESNQGPRRRELDPEDMEGEEGVLEDTLRCGHKDGIGRLDGRDVREGRGREGPRRRRLRLEGELQLPRGGGTAGPLVGGVVQHSMIREALKQ